MGKKAVIVVSLVDESEVLRHALMDYAKSLSLVTEKVHGRL